MIKRLCDWLTKDMDDLDTALALVTLCFVLVAIILTILPPVPANVAYEVATPLP